MAKKAVFFGFSLLFTTGLAGVVASAAPARPVQPLEVYSAMEPDADSDHGTAMLPAGPKSAVAPHAKSAAAAKLPESGLSYDRVPKDQIGALSKRLALIDEIIRKYGRAYDYRSHTVKDLREILAKLDAAEAPVTVSGAARSALRGPKPPASAPIAAGPGASRPLPAPGGLSEVGND